MTERVFVLFAFDTDFERSGNGGWNDFYGRYEDAETALQAARDNRKAYDEWQLINVWTGETVWEKSTDDLSPCNGKRHKWTRWTRIRKSKDISNELGCMMTLMAWPFVVKEPTMERKCARCGERQDNGEYGSILPALTPLRNTIPRVAQAFKAQQMGETPQMVTVTSDLMSPRVQDPLAAARAELLGSLDVHAIPGTPELKSGIVAYDLLPPDQWKDPRCAQ